MGYLVSFVVLLSGFSLIVSEDAMPPCATDDDVGTMSSCGGGDETIKFEVHWFPRSISKYRSQSKEAVNYSICFKYFDYTENPQFDLANLSYRIDIPVPTRAQGDYLTLYGRENEEFNCSKIVQIFKNTFPFFGDSMSESMSCNDVFHAAKQYIQPFLGKWIPVGTAENMPVPQGSYFLHLNFTQRGQTKHETKMCASGWLDFANVTTLSTDEKLTQTHADARDLNEL